MTAADRTGSGRAGAGLAEGVVGRAGRRTNVALLALLPAALLTGTVAFAVGTPGAARVVVVAHGVVGLGVAVLSPWKSVVVRRGVRRARPGRGVSVLLAVLTVATLVTGVAHAAGLVRLPGGVTTMQVHVGAALALALAPLATWHALARPARPRRVDVSRRALLRSAPLAVGAGLAWTGTEAAWAATGARGAERRATGSHERGTDQPGAMPVTQWLFDRVPEADAVDVVAVAGVRRAVAELDRGDEVRAVLDCTGGWYAAQTWSGVRLDHLLAPDPAAAPGAAGSVVVRSVTGYTRRFPVTDLPHLWLAVRCAGAPLSAGHGAPARLVAPGRRGFHWVKWVTEVRLDPAPAWRQPPFPLQ